MICGRLGGECADDFAEGGEGFIDVGTFFETLTCRACRISTFGTCEIDKAG